VTDALPRAQFGMSAQQQADAAGSGITTRKVLQRLHIRGDAQPQESDWHAP